ncbi:MAG: zinc-ribbon domain-containing protein [Anaeroplasma sp.]
MANSIVKQKRALIGLSIGSIILGIIALVVGIILIVSGATVVVDKHLEGGLKIGFGILLIIGFLFFDIFGFYTLFIGSAIKATNGSIKQGNIPMNGTVNMLKCKNCGSEVEYGQAFCPKCGKSLSDKKVCPKCGATNMSENTKCSACGADLQ